MNTIYFAGSIRGGRNDAQRYQAIVTYLKNFGEVLTEHVGDDDLLKQENTMSDKEIHDRDVEWLKQCDTVVAEVTQPSLGVGYELALAMNHGKKVLCLFYKEGEKRLSAMISGQEYFEVENYQSLDEAKKIIKEYFEV